MKRLLFILILLLGWSLHAQLSHSSSGWQPYGGASCSWTNSGLTNGLMSYWKLDETSGTRYDSWGTNHLTPVSSPGVGTGKLGNDYFNSAAGVSVLMSPYTNALTVFSVSAWVYKSANNTYPDIILQFKTAGNESFSLYCDVNYGNDLIFSVITNNSPRAGCFARVALPIGQWYHVVGVYDYSGSGTMQIWTNGILGSISNAYSAPVATTYGCPITIGNLALPAATGSWVGGLDEIGLWTRALTSNEVALLYGRMGPNANPLNTDPAYPWNIRQKDTEVFGTNAASASVTFTNSLTNGLVAYWTLDESSGNFADSLGVYTLTNSGPVISAPGLIGNCASNYYISPNYLYSNTLTNYATNLTVSLWIKTDSIPSAGDHVYAGNWGSSGNRAWAIYNGSFLVATNASDGVQAGVSFRSPWSTIETNVWHHWVGTVQGTTVKAYTNGVLSSTVSLNSTMNPILYQFMCGKFFNSGAAWEGRMDELAIWNRALTPTEVESLYNRRAKTTTPVPVTYPFQPLTPDVVTLGTNAPNANTVTLTNSLTNGIVSYWACADTTDALGTNTLGTSGAPTYAAALIGNGLSNNGSGNYFTLSSNVVNIKPLSLSFWVNPSSSVNQLIIGQWQLSAGGYRFRFIQGSSTSWGFNWSTDGINVSGGVTGLINFGTWTHFLLTVDTSEMKIYTNGVLAATISASLVAAANTDFYIGRTLNGLVDEVGLWDKVLTEKEAKAIYNRGAKTTGPIPLAYPFGAFVRP